MIQVSVIVIDPAPGNLLASLIKFIVNPNKYKEKINPRNFFF
jgi:hypothetical protein